MFINGFKTNEKDIEKALSDLELHFNNYELDYYAIQFLKQLYEIIQFWDDLYDRDFVISNDRLHRIMNLLLIEFQMNPFYIKYKSELNTLIQSAILQWHSANKYEEDKKEFNKAYMLRAGYYQIVAYVICMHKGLDFYIKNADLIWDLYGESFENYMLNLSNDRSIFEQDEKGG